MEESDLQRSPSLERLLRRRPSFSRPPIRTLYSPRLTEDEAEQLTSPFLVYRTRYTYANSSCYDPDLPSSWEVPNLANAGLEINSPLSHIHLSSPSFFRVIWLYILWIFEILAYFVKKTITTLFKEGPIAVGVIVYDFLSLTYLFCSSVIRRSAAFVLNSLAASSKFLQNQVSEDSLLRKLFETTIYIVLSPVRGIYWILDRTGRSVLNLFYGDMSARRYNLRPYKPQMRESEEPEQMRVYNEPAELRNFGGDDSISSINDNDESEYLFEQTTSRRTKSQRETHNLRSRLIINEITDTEDEGFSEKRPTRPQTSTPIRRTTKTTIKHHQLRDEQEPEYVVPGSSATRIAHWMGSTASTMVSAVYWVLIEILMVFNRAIHATKTGAGRAVAMVTPRRNRKALHTRRQETLRRSTRLRASAMDTDDDEIEYDDEVVPFEKKKTIFGLLMAPVSNGFNMVSSVLLGTTKVFLGCCFAVVDLFRMARDSIYTSLHKAVTGKPNPEFGDEEVEESSSRGLLLLAPLAYVIEKTTPALLTIGRVLLNVILIPFAFIWWLGEYLFNGLRSLRLRPRLFLWLLPLLLILLILFARSHDNENYQAIGKQAVELKDTVSNYVSEAWNSLDSEGVYAKSVNSIYDEYYTKGQFAKLGLIDRVRTFFGEVISFASNILYTVYSSIMQFVWFVWELIVSFLDYCVQSWRQFVIFGQGHLPLLPSTESMKKTVYQAYESVPAAPAMIYPSYYADYVPSKEGISNYAVWIMALPGVWYNSMKSQEVVMKPTVVVEKTGPAPPVAPTVEQVVKIVKEHIYVPAPAIEMPKIDEEKLIREITAKIQTDMELKLEEFKSSYKKEIQEINVKHTNVEIDYTHLEALIRQAIYQYDADKTGLFDYALESAGASVISTRCSENYNSYSRLEKIWNIPLWYSSYGPRTVIQRNSNSLFPGECWSFKSGVGFLTVDLSHQINISSISYEHIAKDQAPDGNRSSAPKTFKLWAYQSPNEFGSRFLLGSFEYKLDGHPLQFFVIKDHPDFPVKIVEMEVTSNYGAEFTCLYRLRVHGHIYKTA